MYLLYSTTEIADVRVNVYLRRRNKHIALRTHSMVFISINTHLIFISTSIKKNICWFFRIKINNLGFSFSIWLCCCCATIRYTMQINPGQIKKTMAGAMRWNRRENEMKMNVNKKLLFVDVILSRFPIIRFMFRNQWNDQIDRKDRRKMKKKSHTY